MDRSEAEITRREGRLLLAAGLFVGVGGLLLLLCPTCPAACNVGVGARSVVLALLAWVLAFATAHRTLARALPRRDPLLLPVVALLSGWGLLLIGRLAPNFLPRQTTWLLLSTLAMLGVVRLGEDLRWLRRYRYTWLTAGLALLAATLLLGVNPSGFGPRLWLGIGGAYFQPSEPLKLLMVVFLASYLAERRDLLLAVDPAPGLAWRLRIAYTGPLLAMFGLTLVLLAWQQDLGTAMLFFFTFLAMLYLATGQWKYALAGLVLFLVAGVIGYLGSGRVALRVDGWLDPWPGAADRTFQIVQSLLAFGAGGLFGQGLGLGRPTYIPAVHTDFVLAAVAEEFGLAGSLGVILLFAVLLARGFRTAARGPRPFERLLAAGLTVGLGVQAWIIMAGNAKLAPIAGVPLPFLSYGGSSLLSSFIALGLLLRISDAAESPRPTPSPTPLLRVAAALGVGLLALALTCGYWSVVRAGWLVAREDNPRRVEYEQRIVRGQILDREGRVLAGTEVGEHGIVARTYPVPEAAPVVGYASLRHGTGGVEATFDDLLRGETGRSAWEAAWANLLHRPPVGQDVQLTLDADLQRQATAALADGMGAVVLLDARTGEVLAMASAPTFDPTRLEEEWDRLREDPAAPLVNRATQGLYQPGAALETVVLGGLMEQGLVSLDDFAPAITATVQVDDLRVGCLWESPSVGTMSVAYRAACPGPFAVLGEQLGVEGLRLLAERWGLLEPPPLEVPTEAGTWSPRDPALEAIGQGGLTVSPLQMARVAAAVAAEGTMPAPRLALQVGEPEGGWRLLEPTGEARQVLSPETARALLGAWVPYGPEVSGHLGTAVAGEDRPPHAWFLGIAPRDAPRYAVVVLLEHAEEPRRAAEVGQGVLEAAVGKGTD